MLFLQERERLWRLAEVRGLVMDLGTCCLIRSSSRDGFRNVLFKSSRRVVYKLVRFQFCFILTISPEECQMKSFGKKNLLLETKNVLFHARSGNGP